MSNKPIFEKWQRVIYHKDENREDVLAMIYITDQYGSLECSGQPSYDVFTLIEENLCLIKHIPEKCLSEINSENENKEFFSRLESELKRMGYLNAILSN